LSRAVIEVISVLSLGKDTKADEEVELKEEEPLQEVSQDMDRGPSEGDKTFLSGMDMQYVRALIDLDYRQDARRLIHEAYSRMRKEEEDLMSESDSQELKGHLDDGRTEEAANLLEEAYTRAKKAEDSFLTPLDKDYIDTLQELGEREEAKAILDRARKDFEQRKRKRDSSLLSKLDQEYVAALTDAGLKDRARKTIDDIYISKKTSGDVLADFVA
jgi:vacuolar-type H+-ATPase subunit H